MSDTWKVEYSKPDPHHEINKFWFCDVCGATVYETQKIIHTAYHIEIRDVIQDLINTQGLSSGY